MKKYLIIFVCLLVGINFSCSNWLDIKPSDRISEENNFSDLVGFKKALNGVYIELNNPDLYGKNLSCEFIEILAQRYAVGDENKSNKELMEFSYNGSAGRGKSTSIWGTAYKLIANTNLILKNVEQHRDVLVGEYYNLVKGEALALRALLHFDLFRLFGPVYAIDSTQASIPYYEEFSLEVAPSMTGELFMNEVISDLREAEDLLVSDPIITNGIKGDISDDFFQNRNFRMNYYAVQALLSRAYMYVGQKDSALYYANKIIEIQEQTFPWVEREDALMGSEPDRVFSSEVIFALENRNIGSLYSSHFDATTLKASSLYGLRTDVYEYHFDYEENTDYRYAGFLREHAIVNGVDYRLFTKYESEVNDSVYSKMMPLIRVSELYLNAAEIMLEEDSRGSMDLYNQLLVHRGLEEIRYMAFSYIEDEWYREFIGEGQLFFFYKRTVADEMRSALDPYDDISVRTNDYVLPIPDAENQYN